MDNNKNYVTIYNKIDSSLLFKEMKQLELINLSLTVDELADQIAKLWNIDKQSFDVVCFGKLLDYSKTLDFYGIENGTMLYLLKRKVNPAINLLVNTKNSGNENNDNETNAPFMFTTEQQGQCIALKSALLNASFRQVIENLSEFDNRENLMTVNQELRNDPSLFGVLSDSELLHAYINKNNIRNVLKRYPHFLEVATHVSATFHEENNSTSTMHQNLSYRGSSLNYSIDAISEDEEMDESETSSVSSTNTNASMRPLIDQSFASMLMQAYNHNQNRQQQQQQQSSSSNNYQNRNSGVITGAMLRQALSSTLSSSNIPSIVGGDLMSTSPLSTSTSQLNTHNNQTNSGSNQQHCETFPNLHPNQDRSNNELSEMMITSRDSTRCNTPQPQSSSATISTQSNSNDTRTPAQILIGWAPQLRQMRELGITDDIVAIQALEATNGDVQAAINIIFSDMS